MTDGFVNVFGAAIASCLKKTIEDYNQVDSYDKFCVMCGSVVVVVGIGVGISVTNVLKYAGTEGHNLYEFANAINA